MAAPAFAATLTWNASGTGVATDGAGAWDLATTNWNSGGTANQAWSNATGATDTAVFGSGAAGGTVSVAQTTNVGTLSFRGFAAQPGNYVLSGATLNGLGTINIGQNSNITTSTINSDITRAGGLTVSNGTGGSSLTLGGTVNLGAGNNLSFGGTGGSYTLSGTASNTMGLVISNYR